MKKPFYITTAISYVNGVPHLGHAYETILTDVIARYKRADGYDVFFLTGTDEHGEKVAKTAEKGGMTAIECADKHSAAFVKMTETLNISNDDFIRTSQERHHKASQDLWQKLEANGDIYLDKYEGWYSIREEAYFTEDELTAVPGSNERITPNGTEAEWVEEESYFFRLSKYTDVLLELYEKNPDFIQPKERRNEIVSFVKQELRDLSISRHKDRLSWGIPVPGNDKHVMYVWLDALTNYLTGIGYPDTDSDNFKKYWPAQYHVIGKDITRFHAIYWPAFLLSAKVELPKTIWAHGFINVQGQKMSKSIGNVLSPDGLVETYGLDQIRYFLMREIPHGQDGNFGHEQAVTRINADLANGLGNLAQRTLSMIHKNCDAQIPSDISLTVIDEDLLSYITEVSQPAYRSYMEEFKVHRALEAVWRGVAEANAYVDAQAPWTLKKENPDRMKVVLYTLAEAIRRITIMVQPIMPNSAAKILDQLNIPSNERMFEHMTSNHIIKNGTSIDKPVGVFPRLTLEDDSE